MNLLCNFDDYDTYYDIETNNYLNFNEIQTNCGCYKIIYNDFTAIYAVKNELYFRFNDKKLIINNDTSAKMIKLQNGLIRFEIYQNNIQQLCFDYRIEFQYSKHLPFDYIDDDDWGQFLIELINDENRRAEFIEINNSKS